MSEAITVKDLIHKLSEFDGDRPVWSCSDSGRLSPVSEAQVEEWPDDGVVVVVF